MEREVFSKTLFLLICLRVWNFIPPIPHVCETYSSKHFCGSKHFWCLIVPAFPPVAQFGFLHEHETYSFLHSCMMNSPKKRKCSGFPGSASGNEPACQCRRHKRCRFNPWVRKIPWRRAWQYSCILAWKIPCTEETGALQCIGSQRVRHDWAQHSTNGQ